MSYCLLPGKRDSSHYNIFLDIRRVIKSPLSLLLSRLNTLHCLSHSSEDLCLAPSPPAGPSLDLQHLNVLLEDRGSKVFQVQEENNFLILPSTAFFFTAQVAIRLLGHVNTQLVQPQPAVRQHFQVLSHWAAFQPLYPYPVVLQGVVVVVGSRIWCC